VVPSVEIITEAAFPAIVCQPRFWAPLDGVFYIDVPPQAETPEFEGRLKRLWQLFDSDLASLLAQ
jgi:hypothetical protein